MSVFSQFKKFYHTALGRPFRLAVRMDEGHGPIVVFLHGIAANYRAWEPTATQLSSSCRVIALDLLGFGESPAPDYSDYRVIDQAKSVIHTLQLQRVREPVILVGHSLGALVALEVARLRPDMVSRLVLASPPIFTKEIGGLPSQLKASLYNTMYLTVINQPRLTTEATALMDKLTPKESLFIVNKNTWTSFRKTLKNAVLESTNYNTLITTTVPTDIIYGRFDVLILKKPLTVAVEKNPLLSFHRINEPHEITASYSKFVVQLIEFILVGHKAHLATPRK